MRITRLVLGMFATNCYIVTGDVEGKCILIDPADQSADLIEYLEKAELRPAAVLLTHGHYDHFLAVPGLQEKWPDLPVYCHPLDIPEEKTEYDMGMTYPTVAAFGNIRLLAEGDTLEMIGLRIAVMYTPGHTPGSVTLLVNDVLFTGDTLFKESIGRTDFPGGNDDLMRESLLRLAVLPQEDGPVLPGHEETTTLGWERKHNPWLIGLLK